MARRIFRLASWLMVMVASVAILAWHGVALTRLDWVAIWLHELGGAAVAGVLAGMAAVWHGQLGRRAYVVMHELSHVVAAVLTGRRFRRLRLGRRTGSVEVERPSVIVALAPYVLPLGPLLVGGMILLWQWRAPWGLPGVLVALLLGVAFGWHFGHTLVAIRAGQSDFAIGGRWRSSMLVAAANAVLIYWSIIGLGAIVGVSDPKGGNHANGGVDMASITDKKMDRKVEGFWFYE